MITNQPGPSRAVIYDIPAPKVPTLPVVQASMNMGDDATLHIHYPKNNNYFRPHLLVELTYRPGIDVTSTRNGLRAMGLRGTRAPIGNMSDNRESVYYLAQTHDAVQRLRAMFVGAGAMHPNYVLRTGTKGGIKRTPPA